MPQSDQNPAREPSPGAKPAAKPAAKRTPAADVQPADAGTPASGNVSVPSEPAMKQTSKTDAERGEP
jgi:hypothetical protein